MPTGLVVFHPLTDEPIDVWVGNYVLMGYGDGAVMGVPGHDERDFAFALKYNLPIMQVVHVDGEHYDYKHWHDWYADKERGVTINSDIFSGFSYKDAVNAVAHALEQKGLGEKKTTWRLRDWGISRQRYWGTPIPIIHCDEHGAVPVPEKDLPVVLPQDCVPDGSGNPLNKREDFLAVPVPGVRQARAARDRHHGHLRRQRLVLHALLRPEERPGHGGRRRRTTGCRWTSTSAASSTPSCTCCTRASGPR